MNSRKFRRRDLARRLRMRAFEVCVKGSDGWVEVGVEEKVGEGA